MGNPHRPVIGEQIERAKWVAKAVRLAGNGWSSRRIGRHLGLHHSTVHEALTEEYQRARPSLDEIEAARELHRDKLLSRESRLNELSRAYWPRAKGGDLEAAKVVVDADKGLDRVHASLARLDGLDAPKRTEVTGRDGSPVPLGLGSLTDEQLERVITSLATEGADAGCATEGGDSGEGA